MKLSVIITVYQSQATLVRCVSSVEVALKKLYSRYLIENEIVIVNNGSTDDSHAVCRALEKKYKNILMTKTPHVSRALAYNHALEMTSGDFVCFVNPEDEVTDRYFINLYAQMKSDTCLVTELHLKNERNRNTLFQGNTLTTIDTTWDAIDKILIEYDCNTLKGSLFRRSYITTGFNKDMDPYTERCFIVDYLCEAKGIVKIMHEHGYISHEGEKEETSYITLSGIKEAYIYISGRMEERGCKRKEALFLKFIDEYMKCFHRLSYEEQTSPIGKELIRNFAIEEKNMAKEMKLSLLESIYHFGKTINIGAASGSSN